MAFPGAAPDCINVMSRLGPGLVSQYQSPLRTRWHDGCVVRMSAEQRRGLARAAARALLADGTAADHLTLRSVADRADVPLSTLTYAYGSVGDLLNDLRVDFEHQVAEDQRCVGDGGLVVELNRMMAGYLDIIAADPANVEIVRWQMLLIAQGEIVTPGGLSMRGCLRRIQDASGELWALPLEELSMLTQAMISGGHVQFFVRGADDVALAAWRQEAGQFVEALGQLALPGRLDGPPDLRPDRR